MRPIRSRMSIRSRHSVHRVMIADVDRHDLPVAEFDGPVVPQTRRNTAGSQGTLAANSTSDMLAIQDATKQRPVLLMGHATTPQWVDRHVELRRGPQHALSHPSSVFVRAWKLPHCPKDARRKSC